MEKTWIEFKEFSKNEKEIWNWIENEFSKYLIENNTNVKSHLDVIDNYYKHFPISHRYYFIKNFMWIFMPTIVDNKLSQIKKIYTSLPPYIQGIPGIKLIIQVAGIYGFLGLLPDKS